VDETRDNCRSVFWCSPFVIVLTLYNSILIYRETESEGPVLWSNMRSVVFFSCITSACADETLSRVTIVLDYSACLTFSRKRRVSEWTLRRRPRITCFMLAVQYWRGDLYCGTAKGLFRRSTRGRVSLGEQVRHLTITALQRVDADRMLIGTGCGALIVLDADGRVNRAHVHNDSIVSIVLRPCAESYEYLAAPGTKLALVPRGLLDSRDAKMMH
jgi:hypothetical protein